VGSVGRHSAVIAAALLLFGCAGDDATYIRQSGAAPEAEQLAADASECGGVEASPGDYVVGALAGAAGGFYTGLVWGAAQGGPPGAVAGAGLGLLVGPFAGAIGAHSDDTPDLCMARRGYRRLDPGQAQAYAEVEPVPTIARSAEPEPLDPTSRWIISDPAR